MLGIPYLLCYLFFNLLIFFQENDIMDSMEKEKLRINMLSSSEKVAGQGVSGAYRELVQLLKRDAKDQLIVTENLPVEADVTHFHTIDLPYYLSTFQKKRSGRRIGYVHFLPDTLEGSLKIPFFLKGIVKKYVFSFYDRMEHLVVVNPSFIEDLVAAGIPREKVTYIPNFVNKEKWHPLPEEQVSQLRKTTIGKTTIFKGKERNTRDTNNLPVFIAVYVLISCRKDKDCMPLLFKLCF